MEKTQEILKHIFDLYEENERTEQEVISWCEKNMERYNVWKEALENYELFDALKAVDEYWRFGSNKTKPTVAKILAMLDTSKDTVRLKPNVSVRRYVCPEVELMKRFEDQSCLLSDYRRAFEYVINVKLPQLIGRSECNSIPYENRYPIANQYCLFNDFREVLMAVKNRLI